MALDLDALAAFACRLAAVARTETLKGYVGSPPVENKLASGFDPVTPNDRAAEAAMRRFIEEEYPEHGVVGEELSDRSADGSLCWSLDPIDGTRAFICGLPSWTTLIALLEEGEPVLGVIDAPRLDELYFGFGTKAFSIVAGSPAQAVTTSGCRSLGEARLSTTDPFLFSESEAEAFARLRQSVQLTRYGLDGYGYAQVAAGGLDLVAESGLKPHDYNAVVPLIRAAGGAVSNWSGGSDLSGGQIVAAATGQLLEQACRVLSAP